MKKTLLFIALLTNISTLSLADDTAPKTEVAVAPNKIVEYVEKPVIVYRDREVTPKWKPNGYLSMTANWYGEVENKKPSEDIEKDWTYGRFNAMRLQTILNLNFTEKQTLNIRIRNYQSLRGGDKEKRSGIWNDTYRFRHFYNFGKLGDSKVKAQSRLEYSQTGNDGSKKMAASVLFDFADYFPKNDFIKVKKFGFRPGYEHRMISGHGSGNIKRNSDGTLSYPSFGSTSRNIATLDFESSFSFPYGFSAELYLYSKYARTRKPFSIGNHNETRKSQFYGTMEAYIYHTTALYKNDKTTISLYLQGGYDDYGFYQYRILRNIEKDSKKVANTNNQYYSLYFQPSLRFRYKAADNVNVTFGVLAEYRNFGASVKHEARNWRWQPGAYINLRFNF